MSEEEKELPQEKNEIDLLKEQVEDYKNRYLRALADYDNFKKRSTFEKNQFVQYANENLIIDILPIMDGFIRAIDAAEKSKIPEDILKGLALVKRQLQDNLKKHGVVAIEAINQPFDPNLHEAILQKEDQGPENINLEEIQTGYTLKNKVIRPSMVIVSKKGGK